jgi:hypothetical protein
MALRHIVFWKLNGATEEERDEQAVFLKKSLENLTQSIPEIDALSVHRNSAFHGTNWDLALVSEFANLAALETYQAHPDHVAVGVEIKKRVSDRAAIDFAV